MLTRLKLFFWKPMKLNCHCFPLLGCSGIEMFQSRWNGQSCFNRLVILQETGFSGAWATQQTSRSNIYTIYPGCIDLKSWGAAYDYAYIFQLCFFFTADHIFNVSYLIDTQLNFAWLTSNTFKLKDMLSVSQKGRMDSTENRKELQQVEICHKFLFFFSE